jgi:hypothetical protein
MPGRAPGAGFRTVGAEAFGDDEVVDGAALPVAEAEEDPEVEAEDADPLLHPASASTPAATTARRAAGFGRRFTADTVSGRPKRRLANRPRGGAAGR